MPGPEQQQRNNLGQTHMTTQCHVWKKLKTRGTAGNAQWKGLQSHLFGKEKKWMRKILGMHPSLGPGPYITHWKKYKDTGPEPKDLIIPASKQLSAKENKSVSLTQHHPYVQLHLAKRCLWCLPPANLYHAKNGDGESLDSTTCFGCLILQTGALHWKHTSLHAYICPAL